MSAFVVLLHADEEESSEQLRAAIKEKFPGPKHYEFSDDAYFITGANFTSDITEQLGMDDTDDRYAAILRLNGSFSGNSWRDLWEWLKVADAQG